MATISKLCLHCRLHFDNLLDLAGDTDRGLDFDVEDNRGRFRVWASNLGASQPARSSKSLEFRLRDSPHMRGSVISGLERLKDLLERVTRIVSGAAPNQEYSTVDEEPIDELHELTRGIQSSINHLFALSILIRRQRPRGRLPGLHSFTPVDSSPDISGIADKFPKARATPWLAKRLGNAITQRRHLIQYRQQHRQNLGKTKLAADDVSSLADGTVATTFMEEPNAMDPSQDTSTNRLSICTFATSFMSLGSERQDLGRRIPDLDAMVLDGVQLGYGEPFECPYCRTIQQAANRFEWKKHVFTDLQPYVCTFENCASPSRLFSARQEWVGHEMKLHRRHWYCKLCERHDSGFTSEKDALNHLRSTHTGVTEDQLPLILEACERNQKQFSDGSCPLCDSWNFSLPGTGRHEDAHEFYQHLGRHLQLLALEALPLYIDGLEVNDGNDASGVPELQDNDRADTDTGTEDTESSDDTGPTSEVRRMKRPQTQKNFAANPQEAPEAHPPESPAEPAIALNHHDSSKYYSSTLRLPVSDDRERRSRTPPTPSSITSSSSSESSGPEIILWLATCLSEFNIESTTHDNGYPYLTYQAGEIFDVIGVGVDELWLARNKNDSRGTLGWIWSKHFAKLGRPRH